MARGFKVCVYPIPKSTDYGNKEGWQLSKEFRSKIRKKINEEYCISDESIEEIILTLHKMGHIILKG